MVSPRKNQGGYVLAAALLAVVIAGFLSHKYAQHIVAESQREAINLQGQRLATVTNAVVRYQSSAGNPPLLLSPLDQWNTAGAPFEDGAVHTGLDWLKDTSCSAAASAPSHYIQCNTLDKPNMGEDTVYRFEISNDGSTISTNVKIVQRTDPNVGILSKGTVDVILAAAIATKAEPRVMFTSMGATSTLFQVDKTNAVISANVGLVVANSPYLRRDGKVTSTGTQEFEEGAGVEGAEFVSAEVFTDYDRATGARSTTRFIDMDGNSVLENLETVTFTTPDATIDNLTSTFIDATGLEVDTAQISDLTVGFFSQTDPSVQNQIAGELAVGSAGNQTILSRGNVGVDGVIYDNADTSYFIDLGNGGTSRLDDIVLTSLGNRSISEVMPKMSLRGTRVVQTGDLLPMPSCGTSGTPRLLIDAIRFTSMLLDTQGRANLDNNINYVDADIVGTNWRPIFRTHSQEDGSLVEDPNGLGLAQIYCYYP